MASRTLKKLDIITAVLVVIVSMVGLAAATPYDLKITQASPNQNDDAPSPILLEPGVPHTFSLSGKNFVGPLPETFPLSASVTCAPVNPGCHTSDLTVVFNSVPGITNPFPSLGPVNSDPFTAANSVTVTLNAAPQDPLGTRFTFVIRGGPGSVDGERASATRTILTQQAPPQNRSEFWEVEWFHTLPDQYTELLLPGNQKYLITSGFEAPEATTHIWDDQPSPIAVKKGDRLKYWYDPAIGGGDLYIKDGTLRLYGTFDEGPGDLTAIDPATGKRPENPPYTDPISPFFPQANQSPRKDFVTFNPALIDHNGNPPYTLLKYYLNPERNEVQSPKEKVFKRMWYEKEWFKDDYKSIANGRWDVVIETDCSLPNGQCIYVATVPLDDENAIHDHLEMGHRIREQNNDPNKGDTYAPAINQEFAYMALDDITMPVLIQSGSKIMIPIAHNSSLPGKGLNSFSSTGTGDDAVKVESEKTLGMDINNDGVKKSMDTDGIEVSGDESVVLVLDQKLLKPGQSLQFFDNKVYLTTVFTNPPSIGFNVCDNEGGGSQNCAYNQVLQVGQVLKYQRGSPDNKGPFYIKLVAVNTNTGYATIEVGRLFGNTLANIGANPRWNAKAFIVDEVFYNVVGIKAQDDKIKYIVFRQKLPKEPIKLFGKNLKVWLPGEILAEMAPFNIPHEILIDVQATQTKDKIGPRSLAGPLYISYTKESIEERFKGELKEIYSELSNPYSEFWELEWFHTKPEQYTEFLLPPDTQRQLYLVTTGFWAPEATTHIWDGTDGEEKPIAVKKGDRLKFWHDPLDGRGLFINNSNGAVRLYGTFDEGPGDLTAIDPATGKRPENPPYTDPISPFFPQSPQSPRKDFVTFNPALMEHNEGYPKLKYYLNPELNEVQSPKEKVFKRMWYEKEWFKDDYKSIANGRWDVVIETVGGMYVTTVPLDDENAIHDHLEMGHRIREQNNDPTKGDTYAPAIKQEFAYMTLNDVTAPILVQNGSHILIPIAHNSSANGRGLNSFESITGSGIDAVKVESEQTLGIDIDGNGMRPMDTDGNEVNGDESVVLVLDNKILKQSDSLQFFDNIVTLTGVTTSPAAITYNVCDNEGGSSQNCATGQVLQPGQVAKYQRGTLDSRGPFYIKLIGVNTNAGVEQAVIEVGRLFGNTLANIGANPRWNEKAFIVDEVFYNVVGIKAHDSNKFKYMVFRQKLPKAPIKLYGKHLKVWQPGEILPEMPPFNMLHWAVEDVQDTWARPISQEDKIGPKFETGPLEISYTIELKEPRFKGELKEIYAENVSVTPGGGGGGGCAGDLDGNGTIGFDDFTMFAAAYGTQAGDPNFNTDADLNHDGAINFDDFSIFASVYGTNCAP